MGDLDDDALFTLFSCLVLGDVSPLVLSPQLLYITSTDQTTAATCSLH
jgi:hypothetical protein